MLETFDGPLLNPNCEIRSVSTVAPQALLLMNNDFLVTQSEEFAQRVIREAGPEVRAQVGLAWRLALGQQPTPAQVETALGFLKRQTQGSEVRSQESGVKGQPAPAPAPARPPATLATFCHALLCSNAFCYVN
jgi:hypothetical protein